MKMLRGAIVATTLVSHLGVQGAAPQAGSASRLRLSSNDGGSPILIVQTGATPAGPATPIGSIYSGSIHLLLLTTPVADVTKLKPVPEMKVVESLLTNEALAMFTEALERAAAAQGKQAGISGPTNRYGYEFSHLPDRTTASRPYAYAPVFDVKGSVKGKKGAAPAGIAAAYPLEKWMPDAGGTVQLTLPPAFAKMSGQLIVWYCTEEGKGVWVDTVSWTPKDVLAQIP